MHILAEPLVCIGASHWVCPWPSWSLSKHRVHCTWHWAEVSPTDESRAHRNLKSVQLFTHLILTGGPDGATLNLLWPPCVLTLCLQTLNCLFLLLSLSMLLVVPISLPFNVLFLFSFSCVEI